MRKKIIITTVLICISIGLFLQIANKHKNEKVQSVNEKYVSGPYGNIE